METKPKSLFDHLNSITNDKTKWEDLSESDRKSFSPYLINRFLSMNSDLIELVDEFQKYTIGTLAPREVYKFYCDLLPKKKMFFKYVKGSKEEKYNDKLIEYISRYYECSHQEAIEYLDIFMGTKELQTQLNTLLQKYGLSEKEIKKLLK